MINSNELNLRLKVLENKFQDLKNSTKRTVQSEIKRKWHMPAQNYSTMGVIRGVCLNTIDPWKKNRVQFFTPFFDKLNTPIEKLPWAEPISAMGGFDDCGLTWVPPAGTILMLVFENGDRDSAYYLGTIWGTKRSDKTGYPNPEYEKIHEGHRDGYFIGQEKQFLPQWNTDNYQGFDIYSNKDLEQEIDRQKKLSYPHIYGFKSPQKHLFKLDDGDYKCYHRWKRIEIQSSLGGWMCFKDDPLHPGGQWAHPECCSGGEAPCTDEEGNPVENISCNGGNVNKDVCANKYFKHKNECRPIKGPMADSGYQNNKCDLPQLGIQILSHAGGTIVFDDSVEEPITIPEWERVLEDFSFGCTNKFTGKLYIQSPLGHLIKLNDIEDESNIRGEENGIMLLSASGNIIELNDHTVGDCTAGEKRGIKIRSTSLHELIMADEGNEQCSPVRKAGKYPDYEDGGKPVANANKAYVKLKSGYGIEVELNDSTDQTKTVSQFFRIHSPQKDNTDRGPHQFVMIETPEGPGQVVIRAGGDYVCSTYDNHITIIGDKEKNPSNRLCFVSESAIDIAEEYYLNSCKNHVVLAKEKALILAGEDAPPADGGENCAPTVFPVLCLTDRGITISDRVFVSASPDAGCASLFHLTPFHSCQKPEGCN